LIFRIPDRGTKATSRLSMAFDRLIFLIGKIRTGPVVLSADEYKAAFDGAAVAVGQRRFRNLLPITHLLFVVTKSGAA
jgi:hypothetical protein